MSALWPCHVGKISHSTPSHPRTPAFFLPPLLWCSLSLGVVARVSHVGLSTQSLIHGTLTRAPLHYPLSTAELDQAFFRTIRQWRPHLQSPDGASDGLLVLVASTSLSCVRKCRATGVRMGRSSSLSHQERLEVLQKTHCWARCQGLSGAWKSAVLASCM